ncbi:MAG: hypothetical protein N2D54_05875, partial [Chloroflexota bacterium]
MDFGRILTRAWEIIWKHKVLWIFGFFASCGTANFSSGGSNFSANRDDYGNFRFEDVPPDVYPYIEPIQRFLQNNAQSLVLIFIGFICLAIILIIVSFVLRTIGRIGLIKGTLNAESGQEQLSFGELWQESLPILGRALGLNLMIGIVTIGVFIFLGFFTIIPIIGLIFVCLICLLVPVLWAVGLVVEMANIALVAEDLPVMEALGRGWNLVRDNIANMIVVAIILLVTGGIVTFVIGLPTLIAVVPFVTALITGDVSGLSFEDSVFKSIQFALICLVAYAPIAMLLGGVVKAFLGSAWTLTYLEISDAGINLAPP